MTIEEKLQHFYTASIDSAMQEAQQVQTQHQEALDKIFQEHKETKERQIQSHIQAETDNLKREINKTVSARQLEYRRLLSDKTEEIKQQLFHDVAERLAQFRSRKSNKISIYQIFHGDFRGSGCQTGNNNLL